MATTFPSSPVVGQIFDTGTTKYKWAGSMWVGDNSFNLQSLSSNYEWVDKTSQREFNTLYTNTTGYTIEVSAYGLENSPTCYLALEVGGNIINGHGDSDAGLNPSQMFSVTGTVPNGVTYKVVSLAVVKQSWRELIRDDIGALSTQPSGLGVGQTWQDMINHRSPNTDTINITNKPIQIHVSGSTTGAGNGGYISIIINDVYTLTGSWAHSGAVPASITTIIPAGFKYNVVPTNVTISAWAELR